MKKINTKQVRKVKQFVNLYGPIKGDDEFWAYGYRSREYADAAAGDTRLACVEVELELPL